MVMHAKIRALGIASSETAFRLDVSGAGDKV
jgi:hypothetical protein